MAVVDAGSYGFLNISKSISVVNDGAGVAAETGGIAVNAGASDVVILHGITVDGLNNSGNGVLFVTGGSLQVRRCVLKGFDGTSGNGNGIYFAPSAPSKLVVTDTEISNNGAASSGAGIRILPSASSSVEAALQRVVISSNTFGVAADGASSTAGINLTLADSLLSAKVNGGFIATTSAGNSPIGALLTNVVSANNGFGVRALGPNVTVRVESSKVAGNNTGITSSGGAAVLTAGNNVVEANGSNGAFSGPVALK